MNQKLILINDNIQLDGQLCNYNQTKQQNQQSFFCDNGIRTTTQAGSVTQQCNDYLNIYDGMSPLNSINLIKNMCGMGRLPKIVTKKNALVIEFNAGTDGQFINTGFLFYVVNKKEYMKNFNKFNSFEKNEITTSDELNSMIMLEKLQIDNCNSDMNSCVIQINDDSIDQIYKNNKLDNDFKIGYLFGINQFNYKSFRLSYVLKTKKFNTIAIFLDKYQPKVLDFKCESIYLSIETSNQLINKYHDYEDEYDDDDFNEFKPANENSMKSLLFKICNPKEITSKTIRFFLIKSTSNTDDKKSNKSKTNILVNYFTNNSIVKPAAFDFKINYEFFDFDWKTYQENTICDFIYDISTDNTISHTGVLTNPLASIFYKTLDEKLKCKFKLIAKENQYIKLTIESIDFNLDVNCQNSYSLLNETTDECLNLSKRIVIRELKLKSNETEYDDDYDDDTDQQTTQSSSDATTSDRVYEPKICLCKKEDSNDKMIYVSKYDSIEIEYEVKLNKSEIQNYDFKIKYEFMDRMCNKLIVPNIKSKMNKGKIVYYSPHAGGVQNYTPELNNNKSNLLLLFQSVVSENLNFHCKFHLKAPKNKFIYIEFNNFQFPNRECNSNYIRLNSYYSKKNASLSNKYDIPMISLCRNNNNNNNNIEANQSNRNMLTAHFTKESNINQALSCYNLNNKVCFMTNELEDQMNPYTSLSDRLISKKEFFNELVVEIMANDIEKFNFEIKYHFFEIDFERIVFTNRVNNKLSSLSSTASSSSSSNDMNYFLGNSRLNDQFSFRRIIANDKCQFRCQLAKTNSNFTFQMCLDETLVCDNEIDCIFNESDEFNCKLIIIKRYFICLLYMHISISLIYFFKNKPKKAIFFKLPIQLE